MDALQETMSQLVTSFKQRMETFESELQKGHSSTTTLSSLSAEFYSFKTFTLNTLKVLQQQIELLQHSTDNLEMYSRRKFLLLHGVSEEKKEDITTVVTKLVVTKLKIEGFCLKDISRCHRMGKPPSSKKPRPILLKLSDITVRNNIWSAKSKLKGSGVTVSEFLTKLRHNIFMQARKRFGVSRSWTQSGTIFVLDAEDARHRIKQLAELDNIIPLQREDSQSNKDATATTKTRRAATTSKK